MTSYQDSVIERMTHIAQGFRHPKHGNAMQVVQQHHYANSVRVIAQDGMSLTTLATVDMDFQHYKVHASINECVQPCQPSIGPRRTGIYWWTPGDAVDNAEVTRFLTDWADAVRAGIELLEV